MRFARRGYRDDVVALRHFLVERLMREDTDTVGLRIRAHHHHALVAVRELEVLVVLGVKLVADRQRSGLQPIAVNTAAAESWRAAAAKAAPLVARCNGLGAPWESAVGVCVRVGRGR